MTANRRYNLTVERPEHVGAWVDVIRLLTLATGRRFSARVEDDHRNGFMAPPVKVCAVDWEWA